MKKKLRRKDDVVQIHIRIPISSQDLANIQTCQMKMRRAERLAMELPVSKYLIETLGRIKHVLPGEEWKGEDAWMYKSFGGTEPDKPGTIKDLVEQSIAPPNDPWLTAYYLSVEAYSALLRETLSKYRIPIGADFRFEPTGLVTVDFPCPESKRKKVVEAICEASFQAIGETVGGFTDTIKKTLDVIQKSTDPTGGAPKAP